jgi:hypothetical protein
MNEPAQSSAGSGGPFKKCPMCGVSWPTREEFLQEAALELIGYQVCFEDLKQGLFLFNHACKGTLALPAGRFWDLYKGLIYSEHATGSAQCPEYCLHKEELAACPAQCECAFVREILQIIKNWPK